MDPEDCREGKKESETTNVPGLEARGVPDGGAGRQGGDDNRRVEPPALSRRHPVAR